MVIGGDQALTNLFHTGTDGRYPDRQDERFGGDMILPSVKPTFRLPPGAKVFTIGSCFARNVEEQLAANGHDIPALRFSAPESEWTGRPNGLLNEYNPGTIHRRIERAFTGEPETGETIVEHADGGYVDLLLPGVVPSSYERVVERRNQIDDVYRELPGSDVVVVTLGLVEAWVDESTGRYLNRVPPTRLVEENPSRYRLHVIDVYEAWPMLETAFATLTGAGANVIVTVSPVPLTATFTSQDATVANGFSKAVLRVCAQRLADSNPAVDYYPSYEIVTSAGLDAMHDDNVHVQDPVVGRVVRHMLDAYTAAGHLTPTQ